MRERLFSYIRKHELMRPGDRVGVAVSGGADSVALLRLLLETRGELGVVLAVVHFNHKIRGAEADADEQFVRELAAQFDLEFFSDSAETPAYAAENKLSLEAAARRLRYRFFDNFGGRLDRIATAHTLDDQAETVLLRLLRGSGTSGLVGIHRVIPIIDEAEDEVGQIVRPLLQIRRAALREFLAVQGQSWREDASNRDLGFARNRIRELLLPLLEREFNPRIRELLAATAEIARAEEDFWNAELQAGFASVGTIGMRGHGDVPSFYTPLGTEEAAAPMPPPFPDIDPTWLSVSFDVEAMARKPLAWQRRVLRYAMSLLGLPIDFDHLERVVSLLHNSQPGTIELPQGRAAGRTLRELWIYVRCPSQERRDYDFVLPVPGRVEIAPAGLAIAAELATGGGRLTIELARDLRVRNWRAGDRYWPAHTAAPKKLKELLQARHIPRRHKPFWPVVVSGEQIVWVPGFALPEQFQVSEPGTEGVRLTQLPMQQQGENRP